MILKISGITDCKLLSNKIFEETGLVIGAKSIRNYSLYVYSGNAKPAKEENPSVATLDTIARFVLNAPYTDEVHRKDLESHYPYWFQYRNKFSNTISKQKILSIDWRKVGIGLIFVLPLSIGFLIIKSFHQKDRNENFTDNFSSVLEDSLRSQGWYIKSVDTTWWNRRNEKPGHLSLYTLKGDNWANGENSAGIKNLLMRKVNLDCFMVEIHLTNFVPNQSWQQAGILLSEDSTFRGKMLRLSISYNDFFGGYENPAEIFIQAISSSESGMLSKPEEIAHFPLFTIEPGKEGLVESNLGKSALKIEKMGSHFRFLYTVSPMESFVFKEIVSGDFNIRPKYISIFAIQGWSDNMNFIPASFDSFSIARINCTK